MSCTVVVGTQWGDEGKGKIVDYLTSGVDIVARYQGGCNAGHTVVVDGDEIILHQIPSAVYREDVILAIGQGVIFDPPGTLEELAELARHDISLEGRLLISDQAKMVMPWDKALDKAFEDFRKKFKETMAESDGKGLETTLRGIGPAYANAVQREGVTVAQLIRPEILRSRIEKVWPFIERLLDAFECDEELRKGLSAQEVFDEYAALGQELSGFVAPVEEVLFEALDNEKEIIAEGAQGNFLSIDESVSYPFTTSSITKANFALAGLGLPLRTSWIKSVIGIVKAYRSSVGKHACPARMSEAVEERVRERGKEYGATTKRPRDLSWLQAFELKAAARHCDVIAVTKLDVLDKEPEIFFGESLMLGDKELAQLPRTNEEYFQCRAVYGPSFPGWEEDITWCRTVDQLPTNALAYLRYIESVAETKLFALSNGPERDQMCIF